MKKVKVLLVQGESTVRDKGGLRISNLPEQIEKAVNDFTQSIDGEVSVTNVEIDFNNLLSSGGKALVVLSYEGEVKSAAVKKGGK